MQVNEKPDARETGAGLDCCGGPKVLDCPDDATQRNE